jgi:hypothetical protein
MGDSLCQTAFVIAVKCQRGCKLGVNHSMRRPITDQLPARNRNTLLIFTLGERLNFFRAFRNSCEESGEGNSPTA